MDQLECLGNLKSAKIVIFYTATPASVKLSHVYIVNLKQNMNHSALSESCCQHRDCAYYCAVVTTSSGGQNEYEREPAHLQTQVGHVTLPSCQRLLLENLSSPDCLFRLHRLLFPPDLDHDSACLQVLHKLKQRVKERLTPIRCVPVPPNDQATLYGMRTVSVKLCDILFPRIPNILNYRSNDLRSFF